MKEHFAPSLSQKIGSFYLLWFKNSNQYVVLDETLNSLIQHFFLAKDYNSFEAILLDQELDPDHIKSIFKDIELFLDSCNKQKSEPEILNLKQNSSFRKITKNYSIGELIFEVHFGSEHLEQLIHPQLSHLVINKKNVQIDHVFDIYEAHDRLNLFRDGIAIANYPKSEYHLLQGKFAMEILCCLHKNHEMDWIGTFHSSAVARNNNAAMIIGDSGSGKSTFTALLLAKGFEIIADDITPIKLIDQKIYPFPGGISIKAGAFEMLEKHFSHFKTLDKHYINPYKGFVKYLDPNYLKKVDFKKGYPSNLIVCISYVKNHETTLELLPFNDAMEILIPESWLAPNIENAQQFMNWITTVSFYKLTYSNSEEAIVKFSELLDS